MRAKRLDVLINRSRPARQHVDGPFQVADAALQVANLELDIHHNAPGPRCGWNNNGTKLRMQHATFYL
jgi:hypothetical protein